MVDDLRAVQDGGWDSVLFERRKVGVDGDAAEVVDEGQVLGNVRCGPAAEEPVQNPLVSSCRGTAGQGTAVASSHVTHIHTLHE